MADSATCPLKVHSLVQVVTLVYVVVRNTKVKVLFKVVTDILDCALLIEMRVLSLHRPVYFPLQVWCDSAG